MAGDEEQKSGAPTGASQPATFPQLDKERITAVRLHLANKHDDALHWMRETQANLIARLLPTTRCAIAYAAQASDVASRSWDTAKDKPELVGGSLAAVAALWLLPGWRSKALLAAGLAGTWVAVAPGEVSTLSKSLLKTVNALFARPGAVRDEVATAGGAAASSNATVSGAANNAVTEKN